MATYTTNEAKFHQKTDQKPFLIQPFTKPLKLKDKDAPSIL